MLVLVAMALHLNVHKVRAECVCETTFLLESLVILFSGLSHSNQH